MKMKKYLDMQISLNSTCNEKLIWLQLSVLKRAADHAQTPLKLHLSLTDLVKPTLVGYFALPGGILTSLAPDGFLKTP